MDAYTQLTVRYQRDIPEILKYNAFVVISDGANSKFGSLFTPYEFFTLGERFMMMTRKWKVSILYSR